MTKIKSCPFCGGAGSVFTTINQKNGMYYTRVRCGSCWAEAGAIRTEAADDWAEEKAINRWNQRAEA